MALDTQMYPDPPTTDTMQAQNADKLETPKDTKSDTPQLDPDKCREVYWTKTKILVAAKIDDSAYSLLRDEIIRTLERFNVPVSDKEVLSNPKKKPQYSMALDSIKTLPAWLSVFPEPYSKAIIHHVARRYLIKCRHKAANANKSKLDGNVRDSELRSDQKDTIEAEETRLHSDGNHEASLASSTKPGHSGKLLNPSTSNPPPSGAGVTPNLSSLSIGSHIPPNNLDPSLVQSQSLFSIPNNRKRKETGSDQDLMQGPQKRTQQAAHPTDVSRSAPQRTSMPISFLHRNIYGIDRKGNMSIVSMVDLSNASGTSGSTITIGQLSFAKWKEILHEDLGYDSRTHAIFFHSHHFSKPVVVKNERHWRAYLNEGMTYEPHKHSEFRIIDLTSHGAPPGGVQSTSDRPSQPEPR
ncbi:hypothetical protein AJ80_09167 [Polytolypa hystricis UAMH7299]|uniref:Uncharacterized protein n=1 Tax=Polytolypa hystricis (strain UAMH7299) TaxID=1447883 RepID=A0A2B7WUJ8_POLH7|nr:hypothetical protein AJ80_09167 [Polytolypa hystricis UAMH7299]